MSDANIVVETALRILRDHSTPAAINAAETGEWPATLWGLLEESGLTLAWVPEAQGGAGAEVADGFGVLRVAGAHAAPVPLAETLMAGFLLAEAGLEVPAEGPMTVAPILPSEAIALDGGGLLQGAARSVPFARQARHLVVPARQGDAVQVALVAVAEASVTPDVNLAGEACDAVALAGVRPIAVGSAPALSVDSLLVLGAAVRAMQMAGALERILNQSLQQATDRVQFGRPIGGFQAIQHNLAQLAGEVAAASAAADAAAEAIRFGALTEPAVIAEVAAAKIRVGEAATAGAAIAHQVHGAMGFTYEHSLHHATRRMWVWRDDFGGEGHWSMALGRIAARHGADRLWPFVTGRGLPAA